VSRKTCRQLSLTHLPGSRYLTALSRSGRLLVEQKQRREAAMKNTKVTVTVTYETEYDGKVTESDIDINDVIQDTDAIKDIKIKTKEVRN